MGYAHDIMQTFATKDLHARFPDYDGWEWDLLPAPDSGNGVYRITRYYHGQNQEAILTTSFEQHPSAESVAAFASLVTVSGKKTGRYLLVPQGADVSGVPAQVGILTMTSFGFRNGNLVWLTKKKNAVQYPMENQQAA